MVSDSEGILLVEFLETAAESMQWYVQTLKLKQWSWRVQPDRKMNQVLIYQDNARLHTSLAQRRHLQQWNGLFFLITPTFPIWHLLTSNFSAPWRTHSEDTILWTMLEHSLCDELQHRSKKFYVTGI